MSAVDDDLVTGLRPVPPQVCFLEQYNVLWLSESFPRDENVHIRISLATASPL